MALEAGVVYVDVVARTEAFRAQMAGLGTQMTASGATMSRVGGLLTKTFTLPLGLAGIASTKLALDYETAFVKIDAITNISQKRIREWKDEVLGLAKKTARSPEELGNALYFLASAGLKTSQIMDVLEQSAKMAAVGMGSTDDIARLTANALVAYAKSGLTATEVTNTLVAAVREGTAEPDEFATAMGRILPIASKARIEFDDVAASLSQLSNIGLDVNEGVTAMRGLFKALYVPGTQAAETIKSIGLSVDQVRQALSNQGIMATLRLIEEAAKETADTPGQVIDIMSKIIPNIRALTGAFGLTVQKADQLDAAFKRIQQSSGDAGEAFRETEKGPMFQLMKAFTQLKVVAIDLGRKLIPIVIKIARQVVEGAKAFSRLSPDTQELIIKIGGLLIVLGPLLRVLGGVRIMLGYIMSLVGSLTRVLPTFAASLGSVLDITGGAAGGAGGGGLVGTVAGTAGFWATVTAGLGAVAAGASAAALSFIAIRDAINDL